MNRFRQTVEPTEVLVFTNSKTKSPVAFGPFPNGLMCQRKIKILLNFWKSEEILQQVEAGYFKIPPWLIPTGETSFGEKDGQVYVRFLILEVLQENFSHDGKTVERMAALAMLPKRPIKVNAARPVYMTMRIENLFVIEE